MMNCILLLIFFTFHCVYGGENYYTLLGVPTDASKSQIRKAFKKLALEKHPDKNKGKNAHDIFLEINKAYEVLKDEELRKKYDRYGEAGLKDDHFSNNYQSWTYYNEQFGIYDDDQDIVTLSRTDFEQSVSASEDVWFINFYSPHCTHCHTLAPEWRKLSEDLSGVIRIGAVNCHDDWSLCNMEGISGYPTLRIYPSAEDYYGPHSAESMVNHVFSRVNIDVTYVNQENENTIYDSDMSWVLAFCTDDSDCVDNKAILKISAMLEDLVSVGSVNCNAQQTICEKLQHTEGVYFYSTPADVKANKAVLIDSLDCKEIVHKVLDQLPHQPVVNDGLFQQIRRNISENRSNAWVFIFVNEENEYDQELRKLPALVDSINIGRVICSDAKNLCKRFLVTKYPTVIVYKKIGYEIHHGRMFSHDIANFAKESLSSNVRVMGPDDFIKIKQTDESYFIDFFAPWCPPCMKLLPEWRKAGSVIGEKLAKFGTVDCTVHPDLCSQMSIHSYPTAIFYNMSKTHIFSGYHTKDQIIEFAEDIKQPPVISVTPDYFAQHINKKVVGVTWILKFFAPWCQPCVQMAPAYSKLAKQLKEQDVLVGEINCQEYRVLCKTLGVQQYPAIRLLPADSEGLYRFVQHYGHRDFTSLFVWATEHLPSSVQYITEPEMYQILDSHTPWLLDFYTPWCGHCTRFAPFYAQLAKKFEKVGVRAGKVNCQENYALCRNAGIRSYPSLRYYYGVKDASMSQPISGTVMDSQDIDYLYNAIVQMDQQYKQQGNIEQEEFTSRQHDEF